MTYLDLDGIRQAFKKHLKKHLGYSETECNLIISEFPDPYGDCSQREDFVEECEVDGIDYEKDACYVQFWRIGRDDAPTFKYYTYYNQSDTAGHSVAEYINARKLFQADDIDPKDFPEK